MVQSRTRKVTTHSKQFLADSLTPLDVYRRLQNLSPIRFLFESVTGGDQVSRYSFMGAQPWGVYNLFANRLELHREGVGSPVDGEPIDALRRVLTEYEVERTELPFVGGFVGHFAYDFVRLLERIPSWTSGWSERPLAVLARYDSGVIFDRAQQRIVLISNEIEGQVDRTAAVERLELMSDLLIRSEACSALEFPTRSCSDPPEFVVSLSGERFIEQVRTAKEYIASGDIYQVVLSRRWTTPDRMAPISLYRALRVVNPSPYMVLLETEETSLVGASPEMLVKKSGRLVETRPIAGTRPRSGDPVRDERLAVELLENLKERAEHVMLVDLGRNDIGRVASPGTIKLPTFMEIERYSHVMHIVSSVAGELKPDMDGLDTLMACFPAGTVTGAPKIRAMEIIDELEPQSRGAYAGAVGYFSFTGDVDTCITIRTMVSEPTGLSVSAGAGIVADSDPQAEVLETENKAAAMRAAIDLAAALERDHPRRSSTS